MVKSKKVEYFLRPDELHELKEMLMKDEVYFIESTNSIFIPKYKTTYVDFNACREWADINGEMVLMTAGTAARTEINRFYPDVNFHVRKSDFKLLDISPPMYWGGVPIYLQEVFYYDICHAYAQLYKKLTLDIRYPRGAGVLPLAPIAERLDDWREARNSIVGISRSHTLVGIKGSKRIEVNYHNPIFNPALWCTIQTLLHEIARQAVKFGCVYIGTDCYMFTRRKGSERFRGFLEGLAISTHYGEGSRDSEITGWGSYNVAGYKKTQRRAITATILNNIIKTDGRFLKWWKKQS